MEKQLTSLKDAFSILSLKETKKITAQEKSDIIYRAACMMLGLDPANLPITDSIGEEFKEPPIALYKLQVIRKAVVGEWAANWNNYEYKYSPYYWLDDPGFRLGYVYYVIVDSVTVGGPRLCYQTRDQALFVGQECIWLYKEFMGAGPLAE